MADVTKLGLHARTFAVEHGIRIAGGGVCLVAPLLPTEVNLLIAPATRRRLAASGGFLRLEALHTGPGFHQRAIDREVIRRQKLLDVESCRKCLLTVSEILVRCQ